jgi:hypothetical protein
MSSETYELRAVTLSELDRWARSSDELALMGATPIDAPVQMWCHPLGETVTGSEAMSLLSDTDTDDDFGKVICRFGDWVVTSHGMECLSRYYSIDAGRLYECNWVRHMSEKNWPNVAHFACALERAREFHRCR